MPNQEIILRMAAAFFAPRTANIMAMNLKALKNLAMEAGDNQTLSGEEAENILIWLDTYHTYIANLK